MPKKSKTEEVEAPVVEAPETPEVEATPEDATPEEVAEEKTPKKTAKKEAEQEGAIVLEKGPEYIKVQGQSVAVSEIIEEYDKGKVIAVEVRDLNGCTYRGTRIEDGVLHSD